MGVLPRSKFELCQVKVQKYAEAKNGQALQTSASSAGAAHAALTPTCLVQGVKKQLGETPNIIFSWLSGKLQAFVAVPGVFLFFNSWQNKNVFIMLKPEMNLNKQSTKLFFKQNCVDSF